MMSPAAINGFVMSAFLLLPILFGAGDAVAVETVAESASSPVGVASTDLWAPTIRMILGLGAVLAVLAGLAFVARRLRQGQAYKSGMIEIISGVSLGGREKVVLLRVGDDEVLVGMSPSGMRPLHVMHGKPEPAEFQTYIGSLDT